MVSPINFHRKFSGKSNLYFHMPIRQGFELYQLPFCEISFQMERGFEIVLPSQLVAKADTNGVILLAYDGISRTPFSLTDIKY